MAYLMIDPSFPISSRNQCIDPVASIPTELMKTDGLGTLG